MVNEGFGVTGGDLSSGADILVRAIVSDEFATASGLYFDNDAGQFSAPHPELLVTYKNQQLVGWLLWCLVPIWAVTIARCKKVDEGPDFGSQQP